MNELKPVFLDSIHIDLIRQMTTSRLSELLIAEENPRIIKYYQEILQQLKGK